MNPTTLAEHTDREAVDDRRQIDGSGRTVLLVEDDPATRAALQALLDAQHFQVLMASNGSDALKTLNTSSEDIVLVVSDIVMPEMGGMDLFTIMQIRWPESVCCSSQAIPLTTRSITSWSEAM